MTGAAQKGPATQPGPTQPGPTLPGPTLPGPTLPSPTLQGRRVLVVEDEYMTAEDVAAGLSEAGAETLGPLPSVAAALRLIATRDRIDGALLDVNLGSEAIWPVVDALLGLGVPLVLTTGYDASAIPKAYSHLPRCEKPASGKDLSRMLARMLAEAAPN